MILIDTSVAVPAALPEHLAHGSALAALPREKTQAIGQVAIETYSVLTRLPPSQRVAAELAKNYLREVFAFPPLVLDANAYAGLLDLATEKAITGGGVYDAIVAATASRAGATLLTLDRRAVRTYELLGVSYRLIR